VTISQRDQLLAAISPHTDQHQQAQPLLLKHCSALNLNGPYSSHPATPAPSAPAAVSG